MRILLIEDNERLTTYIRDRFAVVQTRACGFDEPLLHTIRNVGYMLSEGQ